MGYLAGTGAGLVALALILSTFYPIIKKCWTVPFDMLTGGISFLLLSLFYMIIDHWGFKKWAFYFRVIGMNSIFVYLFTQIIDVEHVTEYFLGWLAKPMGDDGKLLMIVGSLAVIWLLLYYMYKKKIFLRI